MIVEKRKKLLQCDVKDGISWYFSTGPEAKTLPLCENRDYLLFLLWGELSVLQGGWLIGNQAGNDVLGNLYLSFFFCGSQYPQLIKQCMTGIYSQAYKDPVARNNSDLHFNRAMVRFVLLSENIVVVSHLAPIIFLVVLQFPFSSTLKANDLEKCRRAILLHVN
ncbi:Tetratricopeptide repeat protein 5 [Desmophyllum pertusum]|uniref:Tetratricopeptide repeat protein 5 n=1 Tax=Desmophyllum pertusum TaxID=174260 RepID=A0A9W9Z1X4_9CNID|nr:Tetratricopeptide repeat protein 5 [Desmophyllum pertusum]